MKFRHFIAVILLSPSVSFGAPICAGKVVYLGTDSSGEVAVAAGANIAKICSMSAQGQFTANVAGCKAFYSTLLAARLAGRSVAIYYNSPALSACGDIAPWSAQPSAYFVELQE